MLLNKSFIVKPTLRPLILAACLVVLLYISLPTTDTTRKSPYRSAVRQNRQPCDESYIDVIHKAVSAPNPPQLSFEQILWISTIVQTSAYAVSPAEHQFLVWGLGYDSPLWDNANCRVDAANRPTGRTAFIENWDNWITEVKSSYPALEVYSFTNYSFSMKNADGYFDDPTLLTLPKEIDSDCWDTVLVDAPQGYEDDHPGRMEATFWSVAMAKRCLTAGHLKTVHVFLHDVNRQVEQKIVEKILRPANGQELGVIKGPKGDLTAYRFTKRSL